MRNREIALSQLIDELDRSPHVRTKPYGKFTIIKIPTSLEEKSEAKNKYYAIYSGTKGWLSGGKRLGLIGKGGFGAIYLTFPILTSALNHSEIVGFDFKKNRPKIDSKTVTPEIDPATKKPYPLYVTKIVDCARLKVDDYAQEILLKEVEIFGNYYCADPYVIGVGKKAYIILEYIPGVRLTRSLIEKLNYSERLALIQQLLFNINLMHHETSRTGAAFIHKDIKPENINVHLSYNNPTNPSSGIKKISAYLMDFGVARIIDDDNPNRMFHNNRYHGTIGYIAPEVFWGAVCKESEDALDVGLKSDIYSLTPVILMILGASNPTAPHKFLCAILRATPIGLTYEFYKANKSLTNYDFSGLFERYFPPEENIQNLIFELLNKMQSNDYQARPNSDEILKFFTVLRLYDSSLIHENSAELDVTDQKNEYLEELDLIVKGQWQHPYQTNRESKAFGTRFHDFLFK